MAVKQQKIPETPRGLRGLRGRERLNTGDIARAMGVGRSLVSMLLCEYRKATPAMLARLRRAFAQALEERSRQ